jgi:divinyl chlorophyllide a 8-vinyl-reductase
MRFLGCVSFLSLILPWGKVLVPVAAFTPTTPIATRTTTSTTTQLDATAIIAGATGYIGRSVVRESVRQGYETFALVRNAEKTKNAPWFQEQFHGAEIIECDVTNDQQLVQIFQNIKEASENKSIDAIVSCLASRSGVKKDAYLIDYQATLNCLEAGRANNAQHFVLLSAFCVKNPWLQFQQAKLKFEAALQDQTDTAYTIVRPTAFFKSVSGQLEVVQSGAPFVSTRKETRFRFKKLPSMCISCTHEHFLYFGWIFRSCLETGK